MATKSKKVSSIAWLVVIGAGFIVMCVLYGPNMFTAFL